MLRLSVEVVLFVLVVVVHSSEALGGYNEPCELYDETSSCDDSKGLMCIQTLPGSSYKCKCPSGGPSSQFSTTFDSTRNRCVGKVFNTCVSSRSLHHHSSFRLEESSQEKEVSYCVSNAECDASVYHLPLCICRKGFYATDEGFCAPVATYGSPCDNVTSRCDERHGLTCSSLTSPPSCQCKDNSTQFYSEEEHRCVTLVHGPCSPDEHSCILHATCRVPATGGGSTSVNRPIIFGSSQEMSMMKPLFPVNTGHPGNRRNPPGARRAKDSPSSTCECLPGFSPTKSGHCLRSHGSLCKSMERNSTEMCNSEQFLECMDSHDGTFRCGCRNPMNERWVGESLQCMSRLGRHCRTNSDFYPPCESGAECVSSMCTCKKGFSPSPLGTCLLDHNERCGPGECNVFRGLTCHGKTGSCLCIDSFLKYNSKSKSCLAAKDSPCGPLSEVSVRRSPDPMQIPLKPFIQCEEGLVCQPPSADTFSPHFKCVNKTKQ